MLNMQVLDFPHILTFIVVMVFAFAYHEFAHAIVADRLGDPTPRSFGRISFNPIVHLDRMGMLLLLLVGFGWAVTPVSPNRLRGNPRQSMAIVAVAGPLANLLMATLYALPIRFGLAELISLQVEVSSTQGLLSLFLSMGIFWNLLLMTFNLLPIPPLDGFTILMGLLPVEMAYQLEPLRQYGFVILMVVIFVLPIVNINVFSWVFGPVASFLIPILAG